MPSINEDTVDLQSLVEKQKKILVLCFIAFFIVTILVSTLSLFIISNIKPAVQFKDSMVLGVSNPTCTTTISSGTINTILNGLSSGQVLCLQGTFNQSVTFTKAGVTLASKDFNSPATINGQIWFKSTSVGSQIQNLKSVGSGIAPPSVIIEANNVVVKGNDISNPGTRGICVSIGDTNTNTRVSGILIDSNRIHNCGTNNKLDHGIYVAHTASSPVTKITNNYIYDNAMFAIQYYPDAQGTITEYNIIDDNPSGVTFSGGEGLRSNNNIFRHNIVTGVDSSVLAGMYAINYCWSSCGVSAGSGNVVESNCFFDAQNGYYQPNMQGVTVGSNITNQNPLYVNKSQRNYALSAGSPCASKGPQSVSQPSTGGGNGGGQTGSGTGSSSNNGSSSGNSSSGGNSSGSMGDGNSDSESEGTSPVELLPPTLEPHSPDVSDGYTSENESALSAKDSEIGPVSKSSLVSMMKIGIFGVVGLGILTICSFIAINKVPALNGIKQKLGL